MGVGVALLAGLAVFAVFRDASGMLTRIGMGVILALALDDLRQSGRRKLAAAVIVLNLLVFAFFYEIIAAEPLARPNSFMVWTWLESWK